MLRVYFSLFFLLITSSLVKSQSFTLYDINAAEFPIYKAKFIAIDNNANQVIDIKPEEVVILEGGNPADIISVTNPKSDNPLPISVVIAIDVSASMAGNYFSFAKKTATEIINMLPLEISECAITSFDDKSYLNCDFTKNPQKLLTSINTLTIKNGTSFNAALLDSPFGAFQITKEATNKKIVIIITDGQSNGSEKEIINQALINNISLYSISISNKLPDVLKNSSSKTGGIYFEKVYNDTEIKTAVISILNNAQKLKYSEIVWKSNNLCSQYSNLSLKTRDFFTTANLEVPQNKILVISTQPTSLSFGKVPINESKELVLSITAPNQQIIINQIKINKPEFKIKENFKFPFVIEPKEEKKLTIIYTAKDVTKKFAQLTFKTSMCKDNTVSLNAGFVENSIQSTLLIKSPNGAEVFVVGTDTIITWKGINSSTPVTLEYSADGGKAWNFIGNAKDLKYKWNVPNTISNNYLIRAKTLLINGGIQFLNTNSIQTLAHSIAISPNDDVIAVGGKDIYFFNSKTGKLIFMLKSYKGDVLSVDFSNDGKRIAASTNSESAIRIFDVTNGICLVSILKEHFKDVNYVRFNTKSDKIVSASSDNTARVWNATSGKLIFKLIGHTDIVKSANFSFDDNKIVTASFDNTLKVWNATSGTILYTITEKKCRFNEANFSPDGLRIVSACSDSVAKIWDVATGNLLMILKGHTDEVNSAVFSKNGNQIFTISNDNTMKIWDAYSGTILTTIDAHYGPIYSVCISNDGSRIYTSSKDNTLKIWAIATEKNIDEDISDSVFSVISPMPKTKDVVFNKQLIGTEIDNTIPDFITNSNKFKVKINKIEIVGKNSPDYRILSNVTPFVMEPMSKKSIEFSFTPQEEGFRNATILIYTPTDTLKQKITGIGIKQQIEIVTANIDFGKVLLNKTIDTMAILLVNSSQFPVTITKIENDGPDTKQFVILDNINSFTLNAGEKKSLNIRFAPVTRGKTNGSINFYLQDISGYISINLLGEGDAPKTLTLYGKVFDNKSQLPLIANVLCFDILSNREIKKVKTDAQGNYSFTINMDRNYSLIVQKDSFLTASENVDLSSVVLTDKYEKNIYLSKIELGSSVRLNNIFFDFAKAIIRPESYPDLDRIVKLLNDYPNASVEIDGHTDFVGNDTDNMLLSKNRAKSCLDYIVSKGINIKRLTYKGFGESKPLADNNTEEGRKLNRRVEFVIIKL